MSGKKSGKTTSNSRNLVLGALLVLGAAGVLVLVAQTFLQEKEQTRADASYFIPAPDREIVARGRTVYATLCAACHGAQLEGQPDWRQRLPNGRLPAPPHDETGHTWHHPDAQLFDIVKNGLVPGRTAPEGYVSDMPAYGNMLSDSDIIAVLAYIKSRWPAEVRAAQKKVSLQR